MSFVELDLPGFKNLEGLYIGLTLGKGFSE